MDQIFSLWMVVEKLLPKGKQVYAAFMDPEKLYDNLFDCNVGYIEGLWCRWKFGD